MKQVIITILATLVLSACQTNETSHQNSIRIPGEFEPHEAIWLGYRTLEGYGNYDKDSITLTIIKAIHPHVKLNLIVEHDSLAPNAKDSLFTKGIDTTNISLVYQSPTDVWYRDPGPVFAVSESNELKVIDFKYTNYANVLPDSISERARAHEKIDREIAQRLKLDTINSIVAIEGGAFETDGQGTVIQVENVTLKRNPHLTKEDIETDYKKCCGIENVVWLPSGIAEDPLNFERITGNYLGYGTGGHTDEFVRFANATTILLAWVDETEKDLNPVNQLNYEILSENYNILSKSTNVKGEPYTIIKIPHSSPQIEVQLVNEQWSQKAKNYFNLAEGDIVNMVHASSYLNYLLTNKVILLPQYGDGMGKVNKKDAAVRAIFKELYPNKKIIGINPISLNRQGGGMHCRYQTQPKIHK
ncbi:MAG: agmatine deiminase family protein [Saprospiraceae bacterium]|nr:agmatine deiminase family protein [Saprospiraceae bacterium]